MPTTHPEVPLALSAAEATVTPRGVADALRAVAAGSGATRVMASSVALFEAGGKVLLTEGTRNLVRSAAEKSAERAFAVAAGPLLGPVTTFAKAPIRLLTGGGKLARSTAPVVARVAGKEILKGATKAAGIGLVLDGAIAGVEAIGAVRDGSLDRREAAKYVVKEAATGAVATGAGVLLGAGLVALTGGVAAPVVFAVAAVGSIGAKHWLRRVTTKPSRDLTVRVAT
jgi:hypothetical protein